MQEWAILMANKLDEHLRALERLRLPEYIRYLEDRKRFYRMQFIGGVFRGFGTAVGFTLLGAVLVWVLQGLAERNLPVIGQWLTQIVELLMRGGE